MKISIIAFFLITCNFFAQNNRFIYKYTFTKNLDTPTISTDEIMFLDIIDGESQFYSYENYKVDSTRIEFEKQGKFYMSPNKEYINFHIIKDLKKKKLRMLTNVFSKKYDVVEERNLNWSVTNLKDTIMGKIVISAKLQFGGREWIAWYNPELPIQDGPYKFFGLPGLIVKLEDLSKTHKFVLVGVSDIKSIDIYPKNIKSDLPLEIDRETFLKIYRNYRQDPLQSLRGRYPDQTDSEGNFRTGVQVFRDEEKLFKERIKKDNNIIELDIIEK